MDDRTGLDARILGWRESARRGLADAASPLVKPLAQAGITADQLSWAGFALAVLAALFAGFRVFIAAGIIYLLAGIFDLLDGALARRAERSNAGGAFLGSMLARAGEIAIHAGAAVAFAWWGWWVGVLAVVLSLSGSYLASHARARAEGLGVTLEEVWFGRGERLILLSLGLIFHFALVAFWILAVLGWASAVYRSLLVRRRLAPAPETKSQDDVPAPPESSAPASDADSDSD
ncbi:MAG: CDP-alcohol phosphatidyltransferase family protein [Gammaproteobacteria bacterium]